MILKPTKQTIIDLYLTGLSCRQVAERLQISASRVAVIIKKAGVSRSRIEAAILRIVPTSKHWRSSRAAARKIWARVNGPIPNGYHIHHINGDHTDNNITNLECISASEHAKLHHMGPHIPRHLLPARKQYMKKYWETYVPKT